MKTKITFLLTCLIPVFAYAQWSNNPYENTQINDSTGSQAVPLVVTNSIGETYISWYSATEGYRYDVFLQKLDKNGNKLWDENGLLLSNHETQSWVSTYGLKLDNDENVLLVTQDVRTGSSNVFAYKVSPDGDLLWGNDGIQLSNTPGGNYSPKMAIADNNDVVFLFGNEPPDTLFNSTIYAKCISADGNMLWENQLADTAWDYMFPHVLHTENDDFIVSWMIKTNLNDTTIGEEHYMHILAQKFDVNGDATWAENVAVDSGNIMLWLALYTQPYLENDGNGGAYVMWQSFTPTETSGVPTTYINRIYSNGNIWKPNGYNVSQKTHNQHDDARMVYMENLDQLMVCWQEYEYEGVDCWGVYGQMFDAVGQYLWDEDGLEIIPLLCSVDTSYFNVLLGESTDNNALVAYHKEYLNIVGTDTAMITLSYATSINADGEKTWDTEIVPLSLSTSYKMHTALGNMVDDQWVLAWEDNISNPHDYFNTGIYAQNITADGAIGPLHMEEHNDNTSKYNLLNFPNPCNDFTSFTYNLPDRTAVSVDIFNVQGGRIVASEDIEQTSGSQHLSISTQQLPIGIYFYRFIIGNDVVSGKFIKQ